MKKIPEIPDEIIKDLQLKVYQYMDDSSRKENAVIDILSDFLEISKEDGRSYLQYALNNASLMFPQENRYDVLACIVKALGIPVDVSIHTSQYEYCGNILLYEYDPAKNGKNILKHQLSFQEVVRKTLNNPFGEFAIPSIRLKNNSQETRYIYITKDIDNNQGILSVCDLVDDKSKDTEDFTLKVANKFMDTYVESKTYNPSINILNCAIGQKDILCFFNSFSDKEQRKILSDKTAKKRFISSRYFTKENLDKTVEQVIKLDGLPANKQFEIIEMAKKILNIEFNLG